MGSKQGNTVLDGKEYKLSSTMKTRARHCEGRQRQADLCELKASLVYTVISTPGYNMSPCVKEMKVKHILIQTNIAITYHNKLMLLTT